MEIEVAQHAQLEGRIDFPRRLRLGDRNDIQEMEHDLHCEKRDQEPYAIQKSAVASDASWGVPLL